MLRELGPLSHIKCLLFCLVVASSNFQYGFDTGIVNGFQAMQGFLRVFGVPDATTGQFVIGTSFQQLMTSLLQVGLIVSSATIGPLSLKLGRRAIFVVASVLSFAGLTIQILVTSQWPVYIGRLLLGLANGLYVNATVLYISEVSPAHLRGPLVSLFQPFTNIGQFIAAVVSNSFSKNLSKISFRAQLAILYGVPLWLAIAVWFIPETPRWLMINGKQDSAKRSLERLRPRTIPREELVRELTEIDEAIQIERRMSSEVIWTDIWKGRDLIRTLLCIACATFHAASGVNFLVGYGTFFFQRIGATRPFIDTIILQSVNFGTSLCAPFLARRFSRRTLLLLGFSTTTFALFAIAFVNDFTQRSSPVKGGKALVALLCIYSGSYGATIGPLSWVTAGEMPSNRLRSLTFGVAMSIGFFFAWLTVFTTPFFINTDGFNWGANVAWIWAPANLVTVIFIYFCLPETKGRTLEELDDLFYRSVPMRKFSDGEAFRRDNVTGNAERTNESPEKEDIQAVHIESIDK